MSKEADFPASTQPEDTLLNRHLLVSFLIVWLSPYRGKSLQGEEGTQLSLSFVCYLHTTKLSQDQIHFPINLHSPLLILFYKKTPPPGCLPRLVITPGPCKLEEVLDLTRFMVITMQVLSLTSTFLSLFLWVLVCKGLDSSFSSGTCWPQNLPLIMCTLQGCHSGGVGEGYTNSTVSSQSIVVQWLLLYW